MWIAQLLKVLISLLSATSRNSSRIRTSARMDWSCCSTAVGRILSSRKRFSRSSSGTAASLTGTTCVTTQICCFTFCWSRTRGSTIESTMLWWVSFPPFKSELDGETFISIPGVSEDREGLLDTIQRNRLNYQKRAYQCIKCLVHLFRKSPLALNMLHANPQISRPWSSAVEWLHDELDRQRGVASQYNYSSWSPPAQSNENTNSFILERSQSAKNILQMAFELCPEEVRWDGKFEVDGK